MDPSLYVKPGVSLRIKATYEKDLKKHLYNCVIELGEVKKIGNPTWLGKSFSYLAFERIRGRIVVLLTVTIPYRKFFGPPHWVFRQECDIVAVARAAAIAPPELSSANIISFTPLSTDYWHLFPVPISAEVYTNLQLMVNETVRWSEATDRTVGYRAPVNPDDRKKK